MTVLLPGLSLYLSVPYLLLASSAAYPGYLGVLPCYTCGCAHTACWAWSFLGLLPVLRPPSGSWSTCSSGSSSPLGFPTFAMGSPLRGRGSFVLDLNEGLVPIWIKGTGQFPEWTSHLCLRRLCAPCPSGCVARWSSLCP